MNNNTISITLAGDQDLNALHQTLFSLGIENMQVNGNTVTGNVPDNMINPLKTVPGVLDVAVTHRDAIPGEPTRGLQPMEINPNNTAQNSAPQSIPGQPQTFNPAGNQ